MEAHKNLIMQIHCLLWALDQSSFVGEEPAMSHTLSQVSLLPAPGRRETLGTRLLVASLDCNCLISYGGGLGTSL